MASAGKLNDRPVSVELGVTQAESDIVLSSAGPDTLHLSWSEGSFAVREDSDLSISTGAILKTGEIVSKPLLVTEEGTVIEASRCWYSDRLNRFKADVRRSIHGPSRLVVEMSANWGSGDNFALPDGPTLSARISELMQALNQAGISIDVEKGRVERMDIAQNVAVPHPAASYLAPLRRLVRVDRHLKDAMKPTYKESIWWKNSSRQLQIYVKRPNVLRVEWRAMGIASVERWFSTSSLRDLLEGVGDVLGRARKMTEKVLPVYKVVPAGGGYEALFEAADPASNACIRRVVFAILARHFREGADVKWLFQACREAKDGRAARKLEADIAEGEALLSAWDEAGRRDLDLYDEFRSLVVAR